jgi:hypothetical protein
MSLRDRRPTSTRTTEALVTETLTAARMPSHTSSAPPPAVHGSLQAAPARPARRAAPRRSSPSARVVRHVVLLTKDQTAWMRRLRLAALRDDDREVPLSAIVRVAVEELQRRGDWQELRDLLVAHTDAGPRRGRHVTAS